METISIKIEPEFLQDIEKAMQRHRYSTLTEFVRASMREKLVQMEKEDKLKRIMSLAGAFKHKKNIRNKELHESRDRVFKMLEKKHGLK